MTENCQYFAQCDQSATGIYRHPILGAVPTCARCAERVGIDLAPLVDRTLITYLVVLDTPNGVGEIEVPSTLGPDAAARRAVLSACAIGWGDIDEITVVSSSNIAEAVDTFTAEGLPAHLG